MLFFSCLTLFLYFRVVLFLRHRYSNLLISKRQFARSVDDIVLSFLLSSRVTGEVMVIS